MLMQASPHAALMVLVSRMDVSVIRFVFSLETAVLTY